MALYLGENEVTPIVIVDNGSVNNQNKTVNPSTSQQSVTYDSGYTGLGTVTVNAMPTMTLPSTTTTTDTGTKKADIFPSTSSTTYLNIPTGYNSTAQHYRMRTLMLDSKSITSNGTYTASDDDLDGYSSVTVNVSGGGSSPATLKTIQIPSAQIISGTGSLDDISFDTTDGLVSCTTSASLVIGDFVQTSGIVDSSSTVNVTIYDSQSYQVPLQSLPTSTSSTSSGTSKATISRSTSDQYINIPTGYNGTAAYYKVSAVPNGAVTAPSSITGTSASVSHSGTTLTLSKSVSVTPSVTTAGYVSSGTAGNSSVSLSATDANFLASNIKNGVSIFGVTGTYEGSGGGASNLVTGTFTGTTTGSVLTVNLSYTGSGYPIAAVIYPSEGSYNSSGTFYSTVQRYAVNSVLITKTIPNATPTYSTSGTQNSATVTAVYKSSTSNATSYSRAGAMSTNIYTTSAPAAGSSTLVKFSSATTMKVFFASTSYGFLANIPYTYHIIYSS